MSKELETKEVKLDGPFYSFICPECKDMNYINYWDIKASQQRDEEYLKKKCFTCGYDMKLMEKE